MMAWRSRRGTARYQPPGFTLIELLVVMAIVAIVAAVGIAIFRTARVYGNETTAVASMTAINHAQFAYAHTCGHGRFAPTILALGTPMPSTGQGFLGAELAMPDPVTKSGYRFAMAGMEDSEGTQTCTSVTGLLSYQLTADPEQPGITGTRFFGTNSDRVIYSDSVTYLGNMPETGAPAHGAEIK